MGAFYRSEHGDSYADILKHYYHTTPPYVLQVQVYSGPTAID